MKRQTRNNKRSGGQGSAHPPQFDATTVVKKTFRFKATAASAADAIPVNGFGDLWCVASAANAAVQLGNFLKIHSVEIWAPMAADLVPVTCSVEWEATTIGAYGKSVRHSDTSMGSAVPAHVKSSPPPGSQISQWLRTNNSAPAVTLVYPANSIVQVVISLVLRDDGAASAVTGAVAGATAGVLYVRALNSPSSTNLVPISVATI